MPPRLRRVTRLDSMPIKKAEYTPEGYLKDRPILTSVGIFEYTNADGSLRRELRLPEEVFDPESLASYRGKPIIVTHDAGLVTKDNVHREQIGTILSEGYQDGDDVRAEIIIHDTDEMKESGLKELSLGYNLDLDESPGVWHGQHYDAIQRNIRINHLALVREARAGDQARLNIDSRDSTLKGGKQMKKNRKRTRRADGILTSEELKKAIEEYKARRAQRLAAKADEGEESAPDAAAPANTGKPATAPAAVSEDDDEEVAPAATAPAAPADDVKHDEDAPVEDRVAAVKENRDRRDEEGDPKNLQQAQGVIADQDDDISCLFDIIDTLLAEKEFDDADEEENADPLASADDDEEVQPTDEEDCGDLDGDDEELDPENQDDDDLEDPDNEDDDEELDPDNEDDDEDEENENEDDDEDAIPSADPTTQKPMNADSVDRYVRARIKIDRAARKLHMDGLESMPIMKAKKKVIRRVRPGMRLDGKSKAYINAAFDQAYEEIKRRSRKDTAYQKRQMFNADSRRSAMRNDSAEAHRRKMIARRQKNS